MLSVGALITKGSSQTRQLRAQFRDFALEPGEAVLSWLDPRRLGVGGPLGFSRRLPFVGGRRRLAGGTTEQLLVAVLLLARAPPVTSDDLPLEQTLERPLNGAEIGEAVHALGALLQLPRRLRTAQHQHRKQRDLRVVETEGVVEQVAVLAGATAGAAGETRPAA